MTSSPVISDQNLEGLGYPMRKIGRVKRGRRGEDKDADPAARRIKIGLKIRLKISNFFEDFLR